MPRRKVEYNWAEHDSGKGWFYVYALIDPRDNAIFYIGRTGDSDLNKRLTLHLCYRNNPNKKLVDRIKSIESDGFIPVIKLLEQSKYMQREADLIESYAITHDLCNTLRKGYRYGKKLAP